MNKYYPEGEMLENVVNTRYTGSHEGMMEAYSAGAVIEGIAAVCTQEHDIIVELPCGNGIIKRDEGAIGIREGKTRDIALISRVGKAVCFKIIGINSADEPVRYILSRRAAQEECLSRYISSLKSGDIVPARVTHLEKFGCFVDLGCGIPSLIPIDAISVSRISHPSDRFFCGQSIFVVIKGREGDHILLSHKELLGTWQQNADNYSVGQTVTGIIRSTESYGIFVELTPNLAGLAEPRENTFPGQAASVFIKSLIPEKMKLKLIIVDSFDCDRFRPKLNYYIKEGHIDNWVYSTPASSKYIGTVF